MRTTTVCGDRAPWVMPWRWAMSMPVATSVRTCRASLSGIELPAGRRRRRSASRTPASGSVEYQQPSSRRPHCFTAAISACGGSVAAACSRSLSRSTVNASCAVTTVTVAAVPATVGGGKHAHVPAALDRPVETENVNVVARRETHQAPPPVRGWPWERRSAAVAATSPARYHFTRATRSGAAAQRMPGDRVHRRCFDACGPIRPEPPGQRPDRVKRPPRTVAADVAGRCDPNHQLKAPIGCQTGHIGLQRRGLHRSRHDHACGQVAQRCWRPERTHPAMSRRAG